LWWSIVDESALRVFDNLMKNFREIFGLREYPEKMVREMKQIIDGFVQ
jgi:hypothetical protein